VSKAQAYHESYDVPKDSRAKWIRDEASLLAQDPGVTRAVQALVNRIEDEVVSVTTYDRQKAFEDANQDRDLAHQQKQAGAAVYATKLKAQIAGHLTDNKEESGALLALAQLVEQVRANGGDMPRGSLKLIDQDGHADTPEPKLLNTQDK
jgi:hypothetical protein